MRFVPLLSMLLSMLVTASAIAACPLPFPLPPCGSTTGSVDDDIISMIYDPADGSLALDAAGKQLTALEIVSSSGQFQGTRPPQAVGLFDVFTNKKLFVLRPTNPFGDEEFGAILPMGLTREQVTADLVVSGALWPRGGLGTVDFIYAPEPSSMAIGACGGLGLAAAVRRQKRRR